ncbi:hypothetical protein [Methylobacterium oryzisoli]|uniref:hypothetical protein n=1 Tax=Methylobacterium oryzisoli TaxID=3385502 RepID=UPI003891FB7F
MAFDLLDDALKRNDGPLITYLMLAEQIAAQAAAIAAYRGIAVTVETVDHLLAEVAEFDDASALSIPDTNYTVGRWARERLLHLIGVSAAEGERAPL